MKTANRTVTATRLVQDAIHKAKEFSDLNIFTYIDEIGALKKARQIDQRIARGEDVGPLAGVPYALKDNFLSQTGPTTASAKILTTFQSPINSTTVAKLETAGAIMIGRTNLDAFAHGSSTENSYFGPTKNPYDPTRVPGGSSGGSAAAVALDIVQFATGTDTGGSIRQPASFNGVFGFKPTYGAISRYGVIAMASSTDCVGFFTRNITDLDLLMQITAGQDPKDQTTLPDFYQVADVKPRDAKPTIGIIKDFDNDAIAPEIRRALSSQIKQLSSAGHKIVELSMPTLKYALAVYYIVVPAEVASNLSRYDGIRYGYRSGTANDLGSVYTQSKNEGFMPENKRRIMIGNFVLSSGFYDAYYLKAQKVRTLIIKEYAKAFEQCDYILTPVSPTPAFKLGEKTSDPVAMYLEDVMSAPINLAGLPSLALPVGKTEAGLPFGLQLVGPHRSDQALLQFAYNLNPKESTL